MIFAARFELPLAYHTLIAHAAIFKSIVRPLAYVKNRRVTLGFKAFPRKLFYSVPDFARANKNLDGFCKGRR
jgi:hypothetical protein